LKPQYRHAATQTTEPFTSSSLTVLDPRAKPELPAVSYLTDSEGKAAQSEVKHGDEEARSKAEDSASDDHPDTEQSVAGDEEISSNPKASGRSQAGRSDPGSEAEEYSNDEYYHIRHSVVSSESEENSNVGSEAGDHGTQEDSDTEEHVGEHLNNKEDSDADYLDE
jgi:hypothetical protein